MSLVASPLPTSLLFLAILVCIGLVEESFVALALTVVFNSSLCNRLDAVSVAALTNEWMVG